MAEFSKGDGIVTFITGIALPSADVYTDLALSYSLLNAKANFSQCDWNKYDDPKFPLCLQDIQRRIDIKHLFGIIMLIPQIFNILISVPHFLKYEKTLKRRLISLPLLIFQAWPQIRSLRLLWLAFIIGDVEQCIHEKNIIESQIGTLEPFFEAAPQVHLTLMLIGIEQEALGSQISGQLIWWSFGLSILSASFGIAKLLKNGPMKLIRKNEGYLGGYLHPGFFLIVLSVIGTIIGKSFWMASVFIGPSDEDDRSHVILLWILTCFLPQIVLALYMIGYRDIWKIVLTCPAYVLLPTFSTFLVGHEEYEDRKTFAISSKSSLANSTLTLIGLIFAIIIFNHGIRRNSNDLDVSMIFTFGFFLLPLLCNVMLFAPFSKGHILNRTALETKTFDEIVVSEKNPELKKDIIEIVSSKNVLPQNNDLRIEFEINI